MVEMSNGTQSLLLLCGVIGAMLYVATDLVAGSLLKGYDFSSQSMSQLSASGASTRPFVLVLLLAADALLIAFAAGVWVNAGQNGLARIVAIFIAGNATAGALAVAFFPQLARVTATVQANTTSVLIGAAAVVSFLLALGFGAAAYQGWFRRYSVITLTAFALLALVRWFVMPLLMPGLQEGSTTGYQERTMQYGYLLWVSVLSLAFR